jgi:K+ transporter
VVVFGDIGTSPLYAMHTVFAIDRDLRPTEAAVYGVISLVFWAITLVVTVKYVLLITRADNHGEGGIMALIALVRGIRVDRRFTKLVLVSLGIFRRGAVLRRRDDHAGDLGRVSYFVSRATIVVTDDPCMARWRKRLFAAIARNAATPVGYFNLLDERTVVMGAHIEL